MKRQVHFIPNKTILRHLILIQFLLLGSSIVLFRSYNNEDPAKPIKKDNNTEIKRLTDIADVLFESNNLERSYVYFNKVKTLCNPKTNTIDYVYAVYSMAEIKNYQGDFITSEANATETLPYLKHIKNPRYSWLVYNILAINYTNTYDYIDATLYFKKAIALKTTTWRKYMAINNLAAVYMNQFKYKKAKKILEILATQQKTSVDKDINKSIYAYVIDNLGYCYYKLGDSKKASIYLHDALEIRLKLPPENILITSYQHLSDFYEKTNTKLAKTYAEKAYEEASRINDIRGMTASLTLLIKNSKGSDLKKYTLNYIKISDSTNVARQKAKNQFSNMRYTSKKDKTENLQLKVQKVENELEIEREKKRNIILYVIILLILALLTFLYFYLTYKSRKEKNEAVHNSEMQISKKLHDELANDVYQTLSFANEKDLELRENKDKLLKKLDIIYSRTRDISKENSTIVTNGNYNIALKEMISSFDTSNINILLNGLESISWNEVENTKKVTIYRVLQELLVNMKKHSNATLIGISFKKTNNNAVITYTDNGKGIDFNNITFKNGLHNIENRILAIKGIIDIDSAPEKGFKVFIKFPI
ncbi:tetratricopeptide repeat protein [Flavobacterium sp. 90]|uniref:tetratricopeptide repeat-containing sensor histidine kinase n=1 Tax=unclassified Flavobacterium TaxID=196869 RepID=UPI000EB5C91C|nr:MULTISPECIES: tetratricopeptide repeat-containing sensor histidine kinase [unclassified Flavobacterium]RKR11264.1 tetratricopeptide repeat protein [Flavobacterium sp. 81]TCK55045.1 tetratricopeptide repeat protein [Flavobacterium sp. 90]